jgi:erythromycin esterase
MSIEDMQIPDGVQIVGLGENTHSNAEFHTLRLDVFKVLVEQYGFRTFALESGFATGQTVNDYIHGRDVPLVDAMRSVYDIYKTEEMASVFQWMRSYNETAPAGDQLDFYGFDIQDRYAQVARVQGYLIDSKARIDADLTFLDRIGERSIANWLSWFYNWELKEQLPDDALASLEGQLDRLWTKHEINDYLSMKDKFSEMVSEDLLLLDQLVAQVEMNKDQLIAASNSDQYATLLETIDTLQFNVRLDQKMLAYQDVEEAMQRFDAVYNNERDNAMFEKVAWIAEREASPIMVTAHDGHIRKDSINDIQWIGNRLKSAFGDAYYAIGTSFGKGEIANPRDIFLTEDLVPVEVNTDFPLAELLSPLPADRYFLDFDRIKTDSALKDLITGKVSLFSYGATTTSFTPQNAVNDGNNALYEELVLDDVFDALINVRDVTLYTPFR